MGPPPGPRLGTLNLEQWIAQATLSCNRSVVLNSTLAWRDRWISNRRRCRRLRRLRGRRTLAVAVARQGSIQLAPCGPPALFARDPCDRVPPWPQFPPSLSQPQQEAHVPSRGRFPPLPPLIAPLEPRRERMRLRPASPTHNLQACGKALDPINSLPRRQTGPPSDSRLQIVPSGESGCEKESVGGCTARSCSTGAALRRTLRVMPQCPQGP